MSNNNLLDNNKVDLPSHYALRVALQTMKERCVALQQRLSSVEKENSILKNQASILSGLKSSKVDALNDCHASECEYLHKQVEELANQKSQLNEHISMISMENRQLWSRLSNLAKDEKNTMDNKQIPLALTKQNLIRSQTFTQHSPNPALRQKHLAIATATLNDKSLNDLSLEEISLKDVGVREEGNNDRERPENTEITTNNILGFGYLNDDSSTEGAASAKSKYTDYIMEIKNEVLKQQNELKSIVQNLEEKKLTLKECPECKHRRMNKPEMADKIIETNNEDFTPLEQLTETINPVESGISKLIDKPRLDEIIVNEQDQKQSNSAENINYNKDFLKQKQQADKMDKMCPMCGQVFGKAILFDDFAKHVETHFTDDTEIDLNSYERNFEFISQAVGNF